MGDNPVVSRPVNGFKLLACWGILHTIEPICQYRQQLSILANTVVAARPLEQRKPLINETALDETATLLEKLVGRDRS